MQVVALPAALITAIIVAVAVLGSKAGHGQAHSGEPRDVRANQVTTADQHEPTLAVDPTDSRNLLSASKDWRTGPKQVWHYRSTDGGLTWVDGHAGGLPTELPNQSDPVIVFNADGTAYMAILGYNQNDFSIGGFFIYRSTDKGATWQPPALVSGNSETVFNDKEWIAVDKSRNTQTRGNLYASWTRFTQITPNRDKGEIVFSRSTDDGKTFSEPRVVSQPGQEQTQGSYPAVGPNGEVYVLYYSDSNGDQSDSLYVARSDDGGATFAPAVRAATVGRPPSPLPGSQFRMFVLPAMAVDPLSGHVFLTWNDYAAGNTDVKLVRSTDGGKTWSSQLRVNDDAGSSATDQFFPTIAAGADGSVHLLWLDRRDDPANKRYSPYYARSTDGGLSFSKNVPISRTLSDPAVGFEGVLIGDYIGLDVSGDGKRVYAAWVDTRNGDQDIYFSSFVADRGPGAESRQPEPQKPTPAAVPSPQPLSGFTDESFISKWERADRAVASGNATRPWIWGPVSFAAALEPYAQGASGVREVQYFDKARMEINKPGGDRNSSFFVTNGLLVVELISGRVQRGDAQFEAARPASQLPVAGDANSGSALTYASLAPVASLAGDKRAPERIGQSPTTFIDRSGQTRDEPSRAGRVRIARYEPNIGHNIPDVFWDFMNSTGPVYNGRFGTYSDAPLLNWETDLGYPITEPYWTEVQIAGQRKTVLVQAFQRRVLTYVEDNPPGWKVEMGNVGRHYFDWRYRQNTGR